MNSPSIASASSPTQQERKKLNRQADYSEVKSLPEIWNLAAQRFGDPVALKDPHAKSEVTLTYTQMRDRIEQLATGLQVLGVKAGDRVALFSENNPRYDSRRCGFGTKFQS